MDFDGRKIEKTNFIDFIKRMMYLSKHIVISGHLIARFMLVIAFNLLNSLPTYDHLTGRVSCRTSAYNSHIKQRGRAK